MKIDDQDKAWVFSPGRLPVQDGWDTTIDSSLYLHSGSFVCPYGQGSSASYTFIGASGIVLNGYIWPDGRAFSVTLDGVVHNMDATSHWRDNSTIFFAAGNLDPGVLHKLTISDYNSDKANCTRVDEFGQPVLRYCCLGLDSLTLLQAAVTVKYVRRVLLADQF
ncbi:hypothetical protein EXIGLDRAFT_413807 [Exidia glandulosa HHB12029]|uniref:Uncharacterized protein n=1 Tax=Exidia glandulosa HHB12029 TaxID=1314781 RepID=A0A165BEB6_EXIGL|nr:hypothetical protein EXIGLDRAFT_413807 [Exidia glandulosa HHB12029]